MSNEQQLRRDADRELRRRFYEGINTQQFTLTETLQLMREISKLSFEKFAAHRGVTEEELRQCEAGAPGVQLEALNKIAAIFGLEVGFIRMEKGKGRVPPDVEDAVQTLTECRPLLEKLLQATQRIEEWEAHEAASQQTKSVRNEPMR